MTTRPPIRPLTSAARAKLFARASAGSLALLAFGGVAKAQTTDAAGATVSEVVVTAARAVRAYEAPAQVDIGPLGSRKLTDLSQSVTVVPGDLLSNLEVKTVNDALRYLPSVEVRDQQGFEVSRPQSRGFQGSIAQTTRMDGLSIVGTSALPAETLESIQVLNGLAGALYGPGTPAGVFDYRLKRPTDQPLLDFTESFDSGSVLTEHVDASTRLGPDDRLGVRVNLVKGDGESWAPDSYTHRTLASIAADYRFDPQTVLELNYFYYDTDITGLPGSIIYDGVASHSGTSSVLPPAPDPTTLGLGQSGAGANLVTNLGSLKLKRQLSDNWSLEIGGLYQDAVRNLFGITNTLTDNSGDYTVTKNFTAVPHFTIGSNEAYLNGRVMLNGLENDVTFGTNGFINGQYNYRNSIATTLGTGNLADPAGLPGKPTPPTGGQYEAGATSQQSLIFGDTMHLTPQWAVQGVLSDSWLTSKSWNTKDVMTSSDSRAGVLSPTVSVIYKPIPTLTAYATYAESVEEGEEAATGNVNANQFLSPYDDKQYEAGLKYAPLPGLLVTLDAFRMLRPWSQSVAVSATSSQTKFEEVGTQQNTGAELFVQGGVTRDLSLFGGVTYIDAKLTGASIAALNDKWVVGVPEVKTDLAADYHPAFFRGVALTGAIHAESQRAATDTNNSFAPAYTTYDVGLRYTLAAFQRPVTLRFQVLNLTDEHYYSSIADGAIVGSPGADTAYLAAPRTFQASLEVHFF